MERGEQEAENRGEQDAENTRQRGKKDENGRQRAEENRRQKGEEKPEVRCVHESRHERRQLQMQGRETWIATPAWAFSTIGDVSSRPELLVNWLIG